MFDDRNELTTCYGLVLFLSFFNVTRSMDLAIIPHNNELELAIVLEHGSLFFDHAAAYNVVLVSKKIKESVKKGAAQRQEYLQSFFPKIADSAESFVVWHPHGTACCQRIIYKRQSDSYSNLSSHFLKDGVRMSRYPAAWLCVFADWALKKNEIRFSQNGDVYYYFLGNSETFMTYWGESQQVIEYSLLSDGSFRKLQCGLEVICNGDVVHYALSQVAFFPALLKSCLHSSVRKESNLLKVYKLEDAIIPDNYKEVAAGYCSQFSFEKLPYNIRTVIDNCYHAQQIKKKSQ